MNYLLVFLYPIQQVTEGIMFWPVHQSVIVHVRYVLSFTVVYFSAGTTAIMVRWKPRKCPTWGESDEEGHLDPQQVCPHPHCTVVMVTIQLYILLIL